MSYFYLKYILFIYFPIFCEEKKGKKKQREKKEKKKGKEKKKRKKNFPPKYKKIKMKNKK